jgi:hypothetical protein
LHRFTKAQRRERWARAAASYSLSVLEWTKAARELPSTIRVTQAASRAAFLAAETARTSLDNKRLRLQAEAAKLGIDTPLPEAVWATRNPASDSV